MKKAKTVRTAQLKVRLKEPLRADLEKAARERGVSLNTEIVTRLQQSFEIESRRSELEILRSEIVGDVDRRSRIIFDHLLRFLNYVPDDVREEIAEGLRRDAAGVPVVKGLLSDEPGAPAPARKRGQRR